MLYIHTGWNLYTGRNLLKRVGMAETDRNGLDFNPRWNIRVFRIGLLTGMKWLERNGILNYGFHSHVVPSVNTV